MFGSARGFLSPLCTLSLLACSLETPGGRDPRDEPSLVVEADAEVAGDAAWTAPVADAAPPGSGEPDASELPDPDAGPGLDASAPDASQLPGDASVPAVDGAQDASAVDAALPPADASDPPDASVPPDASTECRLEGSFAVEVLFDVDWNGTTLAGIVPLLEAGSGRIRVTARLDLRGGALRSRALVTACGAVMPDFTAGNWLVGTENYAGYIPDETWDKPAMPRWDLGWEAGCSQPGCSFATDLLVAVIGARSAAGDVWPGRNGPISAIIPLDHDADGDPAITLGSRDSDVRNPDGVPYKLIPVTWTLTTRSPRAFIPFRMTGDFHGKLDSCDALSGVVTNGSVEARCVGCVARNEGQTREQACNNAQADFLDANLPDWHVSGGTWRARRIPDDANCSAVRALLR
jgi:hypothetical protein